MVDVYANDAEQVEQLKKIWREYGVAVIVGVLIAIIIGFGWRYYQHRHEHTLEHASMRYEQLLTNVVNGNIQAVDTQANRLMNRYPHTPYAQLAALQLARQDVYIGNLAAADDRLHWLLKHGDNIALREIARVRLARVLIAEKKPQDALDILKDADNSAYAAAAQEAKGDALLALGKPAQARAAYQTALKTFPGFEVIRPLLQMKLDDLATADTKESQQS